MAPGTAQRLADAALAILIAEGAPAVTMRRVAADAGVTTMATYRHFPNREALLRTVAVAAQRDVAATWGRRGGADFDSQLAGMLDDFLDFALGQPNLYGFLLTDVREGARRFPEDFADGSSPTFDPLVRAIRHWMAEGYLRKDDPLEVALTVTSSVQGMVQQYLGGRIGLAESDFRALCARSVGRILSGIRG
ncbi:MAG: TetR/AcrR family transcriptional regulator [Hamadaea sp.]|uniref:TetR/AcrR family transcriptional regulator n=1 Tax=Hamadaea sp. TaxID=2024425 RepID=UPI0017A8A095|nr:TetR/AcrR family transcriptional regulator [Hamadaea sp.]NUR72558.1 TetR/AcrR family transcriptional regulator [Hamadaea sp.]NUT20571.1 TetR/AcrR family transcriptional regulator [Hamadaea sp.]